MSHPKKKQSLPALKKIIFSLIIFLLFLGSIELLLSFSPMVMGFGQRGKYDSILSGGSTVLCLGDSVTYGYDVEENEAWPMQLQAMMSQKQSDISVINRGGSGMDSSVILQRETRTIESLADKGKRPVVLLMTGHNDLMGIGWRKWKAHDGKAASPDTDNSVPPRLFRMLKWFWYSQNLPDDANWVKPEAKQTLILNIISLNEIIRQNNGKLYLMTYMLPGDATGKLWPNAASEIEKSREYQGVGNQIIRKISNENDIALIDIEKYANSPDVWDDNWFMDHIHPTRVGHKNIAETTLKLLSAHGEIPVEMNQSD